MGGRNLECLANDPGSDVVAQQLFLGASIASFNSNTGWGGSSSTLTVELVNDIFDCGGNRTLDPIFKWKDGFDPSIDNHYYNCVGNDCYMDEKGFNYDPNKEAPAIDNENTPGPSQEKIVPGKVYHHTMNNGLVGRYWRYADPGFFGQATRIRPDGSWNNTVNPLANDVFRYDLIGVPVYFRFGYFSFGGFITSWECNNRVSTPTYSVTLNSSESLLKNCKVIVSKYAGSIFAKMGTADLAGGPTNYTGYVGNYRGLLKQGNLANVFNVYGFLESYGFGTSNSNDNGIPLAYLLNGLSVLTAVADPAFNTSYQRSLGDLFPNIVNQQNNNNKLGYHSAFSPFGRILAPCMMTDSKSDPIPFDPNASTGYSFGVMTPTFDEFDVPRVEFLLDLSEIPRPPLDVRYNGADGVASISDIIEEACEKTGRDWYTVIIRKGGYNFIKVKTVDRTFSVPTNTIESVIKNLETASPAIPITNSSFGKEKNPSATPRVMYIGANQHRLFQTKSYLLGYSNTHLVYHHILKKFVNYYRLCETTTDTNATAEPGLEIKSEVGSDSSSTDTRPNDRSDTVIKNINKQNKWTNSYRIPMAYSTRNLLLSNLLNGPIVTELFGNEQAIAEGQPYVSSAAFNSVFNKVDPFANDQPIGGSAVVRFGNYWTTYTESMCKPEWYVDNNDTEELLPSKCEGRDAVAKDRKPRYIPLKYTSVCPFFGYANDQLVAENTEKGSNIYRFVRPVYLDTWSGLINIGFRCNELPMLSLGMLPVWYAKHGTESGGVIAGGGLGSGNGPAPGPTTEPQVQGQVNPSDPDPTKPLTEEEKKKAEEEKKAEEKKKKEEKKNTKERETIFNSDPYNNYDLQNVCFLVTESELRAAQSGKDDYLAYCLMKMPYSKPHLFTMLVKYYQSRGKLTVRNNSSGKLPNRGGLISGGPPVGATNVANSSDPGIIGNNTIDAIDALNRNFNWILNPDFMRDWDRITAFVKKIADTYYGKEYLVKLPTVLAYRDYQYADLQLPVLADTESLMSVYQGSNKIFFNYEIVDSAWEELGNYIDDSIIVGSPDYYKLCKADGKIPAIVGYNANPIKDYVAERWCSYDQVTQIDKWKKSNAPEAERYRKIRDLIQTAGKNEQEYLVYQLHKLETTVIGKMMYDCSLNMVPSLDFSNTADGHVLVMGIDNGREDAYSNMTIGTPITLKDGDKILDPVTGNAIYTVDLADDPYTDNADERKEEITVGNRVGIPTVKAYFPTQCESDFVFLDPIGLNDPRARITAPGMDLYFPSLSYTDDPTRTVIANMAAEDYGILEGMKRNSVTRDKKLEFLQYIARITANMMWYPDGGIIDQKEEKICIGYFKLKHILLGLFSVLDEDSFLLLENNTTNQSTKYYTLAARKAHPFYAAIPVQDNISCYGPWTNYPLIADNRVYSGYSADARAKLIEQMINNTDVQRNTDWCPWNYGGMSFLDREIINQIDAKATYQMQLENGTLVTYGMPMFNMSAGLQIKTLDSDVYGFYNRMYMNYVYHTVETSRFFTSYAGLTLTNISTSVADRSITTSYRFTTYSPKLGLFSKEITDRNQLAGKLRISFLTQLGAKLREINNKLTSTFYTILKENSPPRDLTSGDGTAIKGKYRKTSPTQYLVGSASYLIPSNGLPYCGDPGLNSSEYNDLRDSVMPEAYKEEGQYAHNICRTKNWVGAFEVAESLAELSSQYNSKSLMSLDGIFSPVSFYPTYNLGTYPISSRFLSTESRAIGVTCPMCDGSSIYIHYKSEEKTPVQYPCPMCNKSKLIVPSGEAEFEIDTPPEVNFKSLNPIIVPLGEFTNPNSQIGINPFERSRHNIRVIGRQERPLDGDVSMDTGDNLGLITNNLGQTNNDFVDQGETGTDFKQFYNSDYHEYDLDYGSVGGNKILLNQRFFALRGPMMLHGWGYDTDGYPVPNLADQPLEFDDKGRPKKFLLTSSGTNDYENDGKFLPAPGESLGDIIGSGYVKEDGKWTRKPTRYFHLNWGERSDLWPIGPVDLRWDRERKVWTGGGGCGEIDPPYIMASGSDPSVLNNFISKAKSASSKKCPYKMVYIVLEENLFSDIGMTESYPARAFLDDSEYGLEPLPATVRRLVYVKDKCGYSAPRGAKLLCRYNRETGFYEPVSKPSFIVFGTIAGGANTAVIELTYVRGIKAGESTPSTNISFDNTRFNFNINAGKSRRGMFLFENGKWILTGFN